MAVDHKKKRFTLWYILIIPYIYTMNHLRKVWPVFDYQQNDYLEQDLNILNEIQS